MSLDRSLFPCPASDAQALRQVQILERQCQISYYNLTGKDNHMPRHKNAPVLCIGRGSDNWWHLQCNDPEFTGMDEVAKNLRAWQNSPAMA